MLGGEDTVDDKKLVGENVTFDQAVVASAVLQRLY